MMETLDRVETVERRVLDKLTEEGLEDGMPRDVATDGPLEMRKAPTRADAEDDW